MSSNHDDDIAGNLGRGFMSGVGLRCVTASVMETISFGEIDTWHRHEFLDP